VSSDDETRRNVAWLFSLPLVQMTKKLAAHATATAAWVTNVGNKYRHVLMSILTDSEGNGLLPMTPGLVRCYREAGKAVLGRWLFNDH